MSNIISCLTNSYGRFGAQAAIEHIRIAGLEYIELPIRTAGVAPPFGDEPLVTTDLNSEGLKQVQKRLDDHGVKLSSCNVTTGNPLDPQVVDLTKRKLDIAHDLGVNLVIGEAGEAENDEQKQTLYQHLREIADHAARYDITYCCETHPGICQNHRLMLQTMQAVDHPYLKLNFDTGNILFFNQNVNGEVALAKVCQHVRHIHLKDCTGEYKKWYFPALGAGGAVDFVRTLEIMKGCGFEGPYSLEIEGIEGEGQLPLEDYQRRIVQSVQQLRNCGYFD